MTQEDKELVLIDLSARLKYGVKIACGPYDKDPTKVNSISIVDIGTFLNGYFTKGIQLDFNGKKELWPKPYLRPMSSMTEAERKEFHKLKQFSVTVVMPNGVSQIEPTYIVDLEDDGDGLNHLYDWLNKHHFDYRGLIKKGLALEAPEGMYNY